MGTEVDPLAALTAQTAAAGGAKKRDELGSSDFMRLMITQLRNQDPFKPLDPSEFLGQLAQFSTVTGIQSMESSVAALATSLRSSQVLSGATLVGREVLAPASTVTIETGETVQGAVEVPGGAADVHVLVRDSSGQLVRRINIEPSSGGLTSFAWDGLDESGTAVPSGEYEIEVVARVGGESSSLDPLLTGRVGSVTIDPARGGLILNTGIGAVAISDVRRVM